MAKPSPYKTKMREQPPRERIRNFQEVPYGYSPDEAMVEAQRCLQCKKPSCIQGCPVEIDIPRFIARIREKDFLGAARVLASRKVTPRRNLRFLFQHAEEHPPGGAADLIRAGCVEGVDAAFGLHVLPQVPSGRFALLPGPFMAAADNFTLFVEGKGGHAAMPHLLLDPVPAAAQVVTALQALVSRRTDPLEALVISVASIQGGSGTHNVIPSTVELKGTARTLSPEKRKELPRLLEETAASAAAAHACRARLDYQEGYPVLVNDPSAFERGKRTVLELFGEGGIFPETRPLMGGEDFARYAEKVPALFAFLGVGAPEKGITSSLHSPDFDLDEEALPAGTAWFLGLAA